jgi:hypothetical protein
MKFVIWQKSSKITSFNSHSLVCCDWFFVCHFEKWMWGFNLFVYVDLVRRFSLRNNNSFFCLWLIWFKYINVGESLYYHGCYRYLILDYVPLWYNESFQCGGVKMWEWKVKKGNVFTSLEWKFFICHPIWKGCWRPF